MKAWSTALAAELVDWPQVTQKSFFGFTALYRGKKMFALLPRTRSIFKSNAVAFCMEAANRSTRTLLEKDPRISAFDKDKTRWFTFELSGDADCTTLWTISAKRSTAAASVRKQSSFTLLVIGI